MPDPLLKRTPPEALPEDLKASWDGAMRLRGDATFMEVFGSHPELYRWYLGSFYGEVFNRGRAPLALKELLRLRLSTLHGCRFCNQGNREAAREAGIEETQISHIGDPEAACFDARERATLQLADLMSLGEPFGHLNATLYQEMTESGLEDDVILELGMVAGILTGMAKFLFAFDLVEKEDYCPFHPIESMTQEN